jgi:hypothetical protein
MKIIFLGLLLTGILFTLHVCAVARFQSVYKPSVVSSKITIGSKTADPHALQGIKSDDGKHTIEVKDHALPAMDPVKKEASEPEPTGFAVNPVREDLPGPSTQSIVEQSDDLAEFARTTESVLESDTMASDSVNSGRIEVKNGKEVEGEIRIVQITVPEESAENLEVEILPDSTGMTTAYAGGFRLTGNVANNPYCLMVRTRDKTGAEIVQYLPWNPNNPNAFLPHSPMHGYAAITVYESQKMIGRFYITDFTGGEILPLNLELCRSRRMALL